MTDISMIESREIPTPETISLNGQTYSMPPIATLPYTSGSIQLPISPIMTHAKYQFGYYLYYNSPTSVHIRKMFFQKKKELLEWATANLTQYDSVVSIIRGKEVPYRVQTRLSI